MTPAHAWLTVARALVDAILDAEAESARLGLSWEVGDDGGDAVHRALWAAQTAFVKDDLRVAAATVRSLIGIAERVAPEEEGFTSPVPHLEALRGLLVLAPGSA